MSQSQPLSPDRAPTMPRRVNTSQLMLEAGPEFLAEALSQAYQDLDEAESHVERLEDALREVEDECMHMAEDRHELISQIALLNTQLAALRGDPVEQAPAPAVQPAPPSPVPVVPAPVAPVLPAAAVAFAPAPSTLAPLGSAAVAAPVAPVAPVVPQVASQPAPVPRPQMSIRNTLRRMSEWMWDDPPDELDEHVAQSLRSPWRAGFVVAGLLALVCLAGIAVGVGVPSVQKNVAAKTAVMEVPTHYSTTPLIQQQR